MSKLFTLAAAAPKYGWTDLLYSLVPTGVHSQQPGSLPTARRAPCKAPPTCFR